MEDKELAFNLTVFKELQSLNKVYNHGNMALIAKLDVATKTKILETIRFIKGENSNYINIIDALRDEDIDEDADDEEFM